MIHYGIKYCIKQDGSFIEVPVCEAHYSRVYRWKGNRIKWVHDFGMLSKANTFIRKMNIRMGVRLA
jgi:hypothetical protein